VVVPLEPEAVLRGHLALQDLERLELELDHLSAPGAPEVVVVVPAEGRLVALHLARDDRRLEDAGLGEERQGAIDGRLGAADPALLQVADEILDGVMALAREGRLDDGRAGLGQAEVLLVKEALEPLQGFLRARVQGRPPCDLVSPKANPSDLSSRVSTPPLA
jgi:hypothetical protein